MQTIKVKTGFGYIKDAGGKVIAKAELPKGTHPLRDGFTYHEVGSQAELDTIEVYVDPAQVVAAENEQKIQQKIRTIAIEQLKAAGELPADFK